MKTTPAQFVRQVKQEIAKITWPTRAEALHGTMIVIVMSVLVALFLKFVDFIFATLIHWVIK